MFDDLIHTKDELKEEEVVQLFCKNCGSMDVTGEVYGNGSRVKICCNICNYEWWIE
jgi:hypothetical protein